MADRFVTEQETYEMMNNILTFHEKHIDGNKHNLAHVATKAWCELVDLGFASPKYIGFAPTDSVVYFLEFGVVVGLIVYRPERVSKRAMIQVGWVAPSHRGNGLYRNLVAYFERQLLRGGITTYESIVSEFNDNMKATRETRDAVGVFTRKDI